MNEENAVMNYLEIDLVLHVLSRGPGCATLPSSLKLGKGRLKGLRNLVLSNHGNCHMFSTT